MDGGLQTFTELTINGALDDLIVELKNGDDTFELGSDAEVTKVSDDVEILNEDDDTNIFRNVDIGEDLEISRMDTAHSELFIDNSIIRDDVELDNGNGDTRTEISKSEIEGHLNIDNGDGDDTTVIADTTIGARQFVRPDDLGVPEIPVVDIDNGDGSSLTSITSKNDPDATNFLPTGQLGRPTIFGGVEITNGDPIPAGLLVPPTVAGGATPDALRITVDIVVINNADLLGGLDVENFDGHSEVIIVDSLIGIDTKPAENPVTASSGYGDAVFVENGNGFDVLLVDSSSLYYGLDVNNDQAAGGESEWGSQTDIRDSKIGGRDGASLAAGDALIFQGDNGDDVFNISDSAAGTEINGLMSLDLFDGDDAVNLSGLPGTIEIESLVIQGEDGDDSVFLRNVAIESMVMIELEAGVDTFEAREGVSLPSPLAGTVLIDGGTGADFWHVEDLVIMLTDFQVFFT
jgi:hypothetical protein